MFYNVLRPTWPSSGDTGRSCFTQFLFNTHWKNTHFFIFNISWPCTDASLWV